MSVSSLPEWKQLLLERKRREEEEREKREKEEKARLASMPAWKRGIIQRRRMKQESFGDKEDRSPADAGSDPDSSTPVQVGSEPPLSPDITGPWLDEEAKPQSQVLNETIIPVRQNPFIHTHGGWRRGREAERAGETGHEKGNEQEIEVGREREKDKVRDRVKGHDGESGRGRDIEIQIERDRDRSGGGDRDRSGGRDRDRSGGGDRDRSGGRDRDRNGGGDRDRSGGRDRDRSGGGDRDRSGGGDRDRSGGRERDRSGGGDRDRSGGRDRDRSGGGDRDRSGGGDRDRSGGRERDRSAGREASRDTVRDREGECPRGRKEGERKEGDSDPPSPKYPHPLAPGLRTIRADNIIIIEQDRKGSDERRGRRREWEREVMEEEQEKRDVKMDLKDFLAGGGSVTEIRASEVLIIKPLAGTDDSRSGGLKGTGREGDEERRREAKCNKDGEKDCERELEREVAWVMKDKERENLREKDRPRTQAASGKEDRRCGDTDDRIHNERGVRVSELLSKFGEHTKKFREHPKPPSRSKSSECFIRPSRDRETLCLDEDDDGDRKWEEKHAGFRGMPKRSFSFSDQVTCTKENGIQDEGNHDRKAVERTCSDRRVAARGDVVEGEWPERGCKQGGWTWHSDKELAERHREGCMKADGEVEGQPERQPALEMNTGKTIDFINKRTEEPTENKRGEAGFTVASVKNTEAPFARRVSIKHDGRERAVEREVKRMREEDKRGAESGRQAEHKVWERRGSDFRRDIKRVSDVRDCTISVETTQQNCVITLSVDRASPPQSVDSHYRQVSASTECSSTLLSTVAHRGTDWHSCQGAPGNHSTQSALSQHTEDLINKIERVGGTVNERDNHKGTQTLTQDSKGVMREDTETERGSKAYRAPGEVSKDSTHPPGAHVHSHVYPEKSVQEVTPKCPKSPKCVASVGILPTPLEIHIPRTVFYGVGEASLQCEYDQSCEGEGGKGVERRDSWRIGKPLSHIESLLEKIQPREKERLRNMDGVTATGDEGDATEGKEKSGLQTVQRQVEQLQLREQQEVQRLSHDDNAAQSSFRQKTNLKEKESKVQQSPRISHNQPNEEPQLNHSRQESQQTSPRKSQSNLQLHSERPPQPKQAQSNQPKQARSITVNSRSLQTPSPESSLHLDQGVPPTPSSSPSQSPSVSPSPSPSPTHFTLRSSSGGQQVKRGTTTTFTPRKPIGGAAVEAVSVSMPVLTEVVERGRKRYPTAEEIEVIGGYQNLDKSCLVKTSKATHKGVKVCFHETQLEQVCEYPSETSILASTPYPLPGQEKEREEEEEEEERGGGERSACVQEQQECGGSGWPESAESR